MTLRYTVNKDDYFHYCMYSYDRNKTVAKQILMVRLLFGALILLISLGILILSPKPKDIYYFLGVGILWVFSGILIATARRSMRKAAAKQYRKQIMQGTGAEFLGDYTLELGEGAITLQTSSRKSEIGYDTLESIGQDLCHFYVYCGSMSAILLPLSVFRDAEQKEAFLGILKEKCPALR